VICHFHHREFVRCKYAFLLDLLDYMNLYLNMLKYHNLIYIEELSNYADQLTTSLESPPW
jgi:hypothetical protein